METTTPVDDGERRKEPPSTRTPSNKVSAVATLKNLEEDAGERDNIMKDPRPNQLQQRAALKMQRLIRMHQIAPKNTMTTPYAIQKCAKRSEQTCEGNDDYCIWKGAACVPFTSESTWEAPDRSTESSNLLNLRHMAELKHRIPILEHEHKNAEEKLVALQVKHDVSEHGRQYLSDLTSQIKQIETELKKNKDELSEASKSLAVYDFKIMVNQKEFDANELLRTRLKDTRDNSNTDALQNEKRVETQDKTKRENERAEWKKESQNRAKTNREATARKQAKTDAETRNKAADQKKEKDKISDWKTKAIEKEQSRLKREPVSDVAKGMFEKTMTTEDQERQDALTAARRTAIERDQNRKTPKPPQNLDDWETRRQLGGVIHTLKEKQKHASPTETSSIADKISVFEKKLSLLQNRPSDSDASSSTLGETSSTSKKTDVVSMIIEEPVFTSSLKKEAWDLTTAEKGLFPSRNAKKWRTVDSETLKDKQKEWRDSLTANENKLNPAAKAADKKADEPHKKTAQHLTNSEKTKRDFLVSKYTQSNSKPGQWTLTHPKRKRTAEEQQAAMELWNQYLELYIADNMTKECK